MINQRLYIGQPEVSYDSESNIQTISFDSMVSNSLYLYSSIVNIGVGVNGFFINNESNIDGSLNMSFFCFDIINGKLHIKNLSFMIEPHDDVMVVLDIDVINEREAMYDLLLNYNN